MKAIVEACKNNDFPAEVVFVLSNKPEAKGLEFAKENGIKTAVIEHKKFKTREDFDFEMDKKIIESGANFICLAGFMRLLSAGFCKKWEGKMINIHPSLLPEFKGANAIRDALQAGAKITGCTVHFVSKEMDSGPIILQASVPVVTGDTEELLATRVLVEEHKIYPEAIKLIARKIL